MSASNVAGAESDMLSYVRAAAALLSLPLDDAQAERVAIQLAQTAALARRLDKAALAPTDEPASLYCPLPFPSLRVEDGPP